MSDIKKQKAYLFDIDGTLTPSRQKMISEHTLRFLAWSNEKNIFLVTGSDYEKAIQQIPHSIISRCKGLFTSMGNVYHENNKVIYENTFVIPVYLEKYLDDILKTSKCPTDCKSSKHYEYRPGMLNFSICGRNVNKTQREKYNSWDNKHKERENIVKCFNETYYDRGIEACLGGEISIDIQPAGKDKRQSVEYLLKLGYNSFSFFGDRAYPGGNDWGVCEYILEHELGSYYQVNSPSETLDLLSQLD